MSQINSNADPRAAAPKLFLWQAEDRKRLLQQLQETIADLETSDALYWRPPMSSDEGMTFPHRLAVVAESPDKLIERLQKAAVRVASSKTMRFSDSSGIYFESSPLAMIGKVAWLYPGEGAQYLGMLSDLVRDCPDLAAIFDRAGEKSKHSTQAMGVQSGGVKMKRFFQKVWNSEQEQSEHESELRRLDVAMFSVLLANNILDALLRSLNLAPQMTAGHSMGELAALAAAGAIVNDPDLEQVVATMNSLEVHEQEGSFALLALGASAQTAQNLIDESNAIALGYLQVAMDNCPHQSVVVGEKAAVDSVDAAAHARKIVRERLPLARPYHTKLFEDHAAPLAQMMEIYQFGSPKCPVYSCSTANPFPDDPREISRLAHRHWFSTVRFTSMIQQMYADGAKVFIEVGPRGNLSSFVQDILGGKEFAAIPMDSPRKGNWNHLPHVIGRMYVQAVPMDISAWYNRASGQLFTDVYTFGAKSTLTPNIQTMNDPTESTVCRETSIQNSAAFNGDSPHSQFESITNEHDHVMLAYLRGMEDFLKVQGDVAAAFLSLHSQTAGLNLTTPFASNIGLVSPEPFPLLGAPSPPPQQTEPYSSLHTEMDFCQPQVASSHAILEPNTLSQESDSPAPPLGPMMGELIEYAPRQRLVMRRKLDLAEDYYAAEHTVGGRSISAVDPHQHGLPVMPMTFSLEIMAEAAQALFPGLKAVAIRDVCLFKWLPLYAEVGEIEVEAVSRTAKKAHTWEASIKIRDLRGPRNGVSAGDGVTSHGVVVLAEDFPPAPLPNVEMPEAQPCTLPVGTLYNNLFHGPMFQGVKSLDHISPTAISATLEVGPRNCVLTSQSQPDFLLDPVLLDVVLHPMAGWHLEQIDQSGRILLPYEVSSLELVGPPPQVGESIRVLGRLESGSTRRFSHGSTALRQDGSLWCRMQGVKCWWFYLPFGDVNFHGPKNVYYLAREYSHILPSELDPMDIACMHLIPPEDLVQSALQEAGARVMLEPSELAIYEAMPADARRRGEWLFGRATVKDAVRTLWTRRYSEKLFMSDVIIRPDEQGRPLAVPRNREESRPFPNVSLSHSHGALIAVASFNNYVGVDMEKIEPRSTGFDEIAFDEAERALIEECAKQGMPRDEVVTRFWAAKECLCKAAGTGMADGPRSALVRTFDISTGQCNVVLAESIQKRASLNHAGPTTVFTHKEGDYAIALGWISYRM